MKTEIIISVRVYSIILIVMKNLKYNFYGDRKLKIELYNDE